ncbi:hypothetical protein Pla175_32110 [Pirellulimonas nuda]|uniref:Planctomycete cytochrome C n=2 Tax=Pirellulimonas nuda TaxID=2528009 RepID=A0A518DEA6_9BACT|nr:hypothetical protein Pla175_32110 [Pirellulimonas nuda]
MDAAVGLVENYCLDCHNSFEATAGLDLEGFSETVPQVRAGSDAAAWEKMVRRLRSRQMPPTGAARPEEEEYRQALSAMQSLLDQAAAAHPQPGRTDSIRRLNRTEYHNAIRDLLALDTDVNAILPADESGHGFDNVTVGDLSPALLSRYITAAERISRLAVGGAVHGPTGVNVRIPADLTQDSHVQGLPLGTRGGTVFDYQFPAAGEYEIQLRLTRDRDEHVEGLRGSHDIDVLIDRKLLHRFTVSPKDERADARVEDGLRKRFWIGAGPHQVGAAFPQKGASLSEIKRQPFEASFNRHRHPRRTPALFEVSIVGPLDGSGAADSANASSGAAGDTPSRQRLLSCTPTTAAEAPDCAREILRPLMRRAYRRPVTDDDLVVPMEFFEQGYAEGGFEAGIESALAAVLVNPYFLLRAESQPSGLVSGEAYRISDLELASRLSFFLWSSVPDDTLLTLAEQNRLHEPEVLREQTRRMLEDERSQSLVTNFAAQWLYLRNLDSFRPDMRLFPDFDDNLRQAMRKETELLFDHVMRADRSVLELIDTDTAFLNERLARHYGVRGVVGSQFRPVKLKEGDGPRGGLLRNASVLAVTSYATRTSPTVRGNWILGNILGSPLPPPPPNVPSLKDKQESVAVSIRERLAEHRANPACASCHDVMDPVGFSLENFDAVGRWRVIDEGEKIDPSGELPDGAPISDFTDLEESILERPEMFVGALTEKLLTFALGRGVETYDGPAVRKVVRQAEAEDYRFSSLITAVVSSVPFQMRMAE